VHLKVEESRFKRRLECGRQASRDDRKVVERWEFKTDKQKI
jgi:hypothetical protein